MAGNHKKRKLFLSAILAVLTCVVVVVSPVLAFDVDENSREHQELEEQNSQYQQELTETNKTLQEKQKYSQELQKKIKTLTDQIKKSNQTIEQLTKEIAEKQKLIDAKLAEIQDRMDLLRERLRAIYVAGDVSTLEIILQAKDFNDFIDKMELVQSISAYDNKLISELQAEMDTISADQEKLKQDKAQIEAEKKQMEKDKASVNQLSKENEALILELREAKENTQAAIKDNNERQKELERALAEYNEAMAEQLRQERIRQQQEARAAAGEVEILVESDGTYVWPCPGFTYLTSLFEEWRGTRNHGAIDIAGSGIYGTKVIACWDGVVFSTNEGCPHDYGKESSCGCGGGFGNYVMVDHENGKISIYAHLSGVAVNEGQRVVAGQVLGYVGSTGYSTGPHLHFETRYNGIRYDPLTEYE